MSASNVRPLPSERDHRLEVKLLRELGVIGPLLTDDTVVEIMLNPDGRLWVERHGHLMECVGSMDPQQAESIMTTVASIYDTTITATSPILECELPFDGSRFQGVIPPVVSGPTFAIRRKAIQIFTLDRYVTDQIMTPRQRDRIEQAVLKRENILVVGGTASGKTTLTNAIIASIAQHFPADRMLIVEDTAEIQSASENNVRLLTSDHVDMQTLLKCTMRLRPTRIVVGEVRGPDALTLVDAWNTGHPGGVATVHANDAGQGLVRIEALIRRGIKGPIPKKEIAAAINLVVSIQKTAQGRLVREVLSVHGYDPIKRAYITTPTQE